MHLGELLIDWVWLFMNVRKKKKKKKKNLANSQLMVSKQMLLGYPFGIFVLGRPNELLHKRHKSEICVIECNKLLHIFVDMWRKYPVVA